MGLRLSHVSLQSSSMRLMFGMAAVVSFVVGCSSPEATRMRSGGPGGDIGNRGSAVQMHEGAQQYWKTPERLNKDVGMRDLGPAQHADRSSRGQPAAAPRQ
jgi:hypothetical protein